MKRYVCAFALLTAAPPLPAQENSSELKRRVTTCGEMYRNDLEFPKAALNAQTPFDPACWVRIFEDYKGQKQTVLYSPHRPYQFSRILNADRDSTIVLDFAEGLNANGDLGLNGLIARARIVRTDGTEAPIEVRNYTQIEFTDEQRKAQRAFGFQTFANVSSVVLDLYWTTRELIYRLPNGKACYEALVEQKTSTPALAAQSCALSDYDTNDNSELAKRLRLYEPEAKAIIDFLLSAANQTVNAQLAIRLFGVSGSSLRNVAQQMQTNFAKLADKDTKDAERPHIRRQIAERIFNVAHDFAWAYHEIKHLGELAAQVEVLPNGKSVKLDPVESNNELKRYCPFTMEQPPAFTPRRRELDAEEFARACFIESERTKYARELENFLMMGTISLRNNGARAGDTIKIQVEARGADDATRGAIGEFEVRVTSYGWKWAATDSVLFIERLRVTPKETGFPPKPADVPPPRTVEEAESHNRLYGRAAGQLRKVRFRPFPGFNLVSTFYHRGGRAVDANDDVQDDLTDGAKKNKDMNKQRWLPASKFQLPGRGPGHTVLRALSPGIGINTSLVNFGDDDATAVQLAVGPILTLFDNRVSVTTGWNLMARERRWYWGLGFSFLKLTDDVMGRFGKNR